MEGNPVRETLDALIRQRGEDYASISRLIGRNAAYIQQFIRRGVPRKLDEDDRRLLARYFSIDETLLGGPAKAQAASGEPMPGALVTVARLPVAASAGPGMLAEDGAAAGGIAFERRYLRALSGDAGALSLIRVEGDSMMPTLNDGDDIMVDGNDAAGRLRDGIYVLRVDGVLVVKRLAVAPAGGGIDILSDNPDYPSWRGCDPALIDLIGRVIWAGRRIR